MSSCNRVGSEIDTGRSDRPCDRVGCAGNAFAHLGRPNDGLPRCEAFGCGLSHEDEKKRLGDHKGS